VYSVIFIILASCGYVWNVQKLVVAITSLSQLYCWPLLLG